MNISAVSPHVRHSVKYLSALVTCSPALVDCNVLAGGARVVKHFSTQRASPLSSAVTPCLLREGRCGGRKLVLDHVTVTVIVKIVIDFIVNCGDNILAVGIMFRFLGSRSISSSRTIILNRYLFHFTRWFSYWYRTGLFHRR